MGPTSALPGLPLEAQSVRCFHVGAELDYLGLNNMAVPLIGPIFHGEFEFRYTCKQEVHELGQRLLKQAI
ncbi:hypothetical protein CCACVL1_04379 [Corchorus capsularis]|uniref:Uncharacterized protein n=1 Tax=Corchorus capsularis TaxID=210143 RepID=A0A1R3JTA7_COCAP|nr:hypothetical protein CCACVL1_04379 [Corchorus capsularis]